MKVKKFGIISEVENELNFSYFHFDTEGVAPPISSSDMIKAISDYILNLKMKHISYDANGVGIIGCHFNSSPNEWDGEGLPPVGVRCEFISNDTSWGEVDVIGIDGGKVVFKPSGETYYGIVPSQRQIFRPIRSEADRKKEAAIFAIAELCRESASNGHSGELIYDAIKSGKIVID